MFLASQANANRAIDILEDKFEQVGLTEEFEIGIQSFKSYFNIDDQYFNTKISNPSTSDIEDKKKTKEKFADFIAEINQKNQILYDYVKNKIRFHFKDKKSDKNVKVKSKLLVRKFNKWSHYVENQLKFKETKLTWYNIQKFYKRWYK